MFKGNRAAIIVCLGAVPTILIIAATAVGQSDPASPTAIRLRALAYIFMGGLFLFLSIRQFLIGKRLMALLSIVVALLLFVDPIRKLSAAGLLGKIPGISH